VELKNKKVRNFYAQTLVLGRSVRIVSSKCL
jgi:hypothetical protein